MAGHSARLTARRQRRPRVTATEHAQHLKAPLAPLLVAREQQQDEITAIERRAEDIARFIADGKQRTDALDQVTRLARHMPERLAALDPEGMRLVINTLDLHAALQDPKDANSVIRITSRRSISDLLQADHLRDVDASSTEA